VIIFVFVRPIFIADIGAVHRAGRWRLLPLHVHCWPKNPRHYTLACNFTHC